VSYNQSGIPWDPTGPYHKDDTDQMTAPVDTNVEREMEAFEHRVMEVSPEQTVEAALREYEKNYRKAAEQRWEGQDRWQGKENEEMRMVNIIHANTFMRKLRDGGISQKRVWMNDWSRLKRIGINARVLNKEREIWEDKTITTHQYPYAPEWSLMRFDRYDVPTNERFRGWRTTLLALIIGT
jgi:hypothetical protein